MARAAEKRNRRTPSKSTPEQSERGTMNDDGAEPTYVMAFGSAQFVLEARDGGRCAKCLDQMPEERAGRVVCRHCEPKFD